MRTNAWIIVELTRALSWRTWLRWDAGDREAPEPELSAWERKAAQRLHDMEYIFKGFLRPSILGKVWIMISVYDVTPGEIASGYNQLGDAATGGDFGCVGFWTWEEGQGQSAFLDLYPWLPNQALKFMPPIEGVPAESVRDVNVLFGQPLREFPS